MTTDVRPNDFFEGPGAVDKFEALKDKFVAKGLAIDSLAQSGQIAFSPKEGAVKSGAASREELLVKAGVTPDMIKEWTTSLPVPSTAVAQAALTPYDYEAEVLWLVPNDTPVRNTVAREKGVGEGTEYRRLTGISNSRTAGAANLSPFFVSEGTANVTNNVNLNRAAIMAEVGDKTWTQYVEMGLQTQVSMKYQFAAQGYADIRALAHLAMLRSGWFAEENAILNGRSTAFPITSLAATAEQSTTVTSGSGLPAITASTPTGDVYITFSSSWGESKALKLTAISVSAGFGIDIDISAGIPTGAIATNVYINDGTNLWKGTTAYSNAAEIPSPTVFVNVGLSATAPSTTADNGSYPNYVYGGTLVANAASGTVVGYDGMLNTFTGANSGYTTSVNAALSTSAPFSELYTAFQTLAQNNAARPDMVITTYSIRAAMWQLVQAANSASTNFRVNLQSGDGGAIVGDAVTAVVNSATGDTVNVQGHRFAQPGTIIIHSTKVPWADSNVNATVKIKSVVSDMVLDFPQVGMTYDAQTYFYGTCLLQAPVLSGAIIGVLN